MNLSRRLKCFYCLRHRPVKHPRGAKLPRMGSFNSQVALDFLYPVDADGKTYQVLHIKDLSGMLSACVPTETCDS